MTQGLSHAATLASRNSEGVIAEVEMALILQVWGRKGLIKF